MEALLPWVPVVGLIGLGYAMWRTAWIGKLDAGNERIQRIGKAIAEGAMAFLAAEYKRLILFVIVVAALLALSNTGPGKSPLVAVSFILGATASGLAGFIGMRVATKSNYRTTQAARKGLPEALRVAFQGGSVMGMSVVALGVLGLGVLYLIYRPLFADIKLTVAVISGFSLGASSIALFARVGGGIYTKAADVGADLVGKVEAGIPEDHPINPAVIADNVGDDVGDVAGMGADLFESYVGSIVGSMVIGASVLLAGKIDLTFVGFPLIVAAAGILVSIIGTFFVSVKEGGNPQAGLNRGGVGSSILMIVVLFFLVKVFLPPQFTLDGVTYTSMGVFWATLFGLIAGVAIGFLTEYYTGLGSPPVRFIARQSLTGAATNLIAGISVGMQSTALPLLILAASILGAYHFAGLYGIAMAALGMLANTGMQLSVDAYGPISDNAGGIAEMAQLPAEVRKRTDRLDAVGNTTAAIGKGFAIGSAALTALALFAAFRTTVASVRAAHGLTNTTVNIDVTNALVMAGLFIGGMMPFLFSSMALKAVGKAAMSMIEEVRRQFRTIPELGAALKILKKESQGEKLTDEDQALLDAATEKVESKECVTISTDAAIKAMVLPGLMAVITPVVVGFVFGAEALGGLLAGVTVTGVLMAIFQANAGGAWDNAKKMIENDFEVDGKVYSKGSDAHKAAVVGDTVGDPFKDTSGPSLNILIKLMSVVSLVIAPLIAMVNV